MNLLWLLLYPAFTLAGLLLLGAFYAWDEWHARVPRDQAKAYECLALERAARIAELEHELGIQSLASPDEALIEDAQVAALDAIWEMPAREPLT